MVDVAQMTDDELREQLTQFGVNVGPVTSTTRLFYEKKLGRLLESGGNSASASEEEEEEEEEVEEDEEVQINYGRHQEALQNVCQTVRSSEPVASSPARTPITQARTASPSRGAVKRNVAGSTSQAPSSKLLAPTQKQSSSGGMGMWIKLVFVVVVAILVYLVIVNMNPSAQNKIPSSFSKK